MRKRNYLRTAVSITLAALMVLSFTGCFLNDFPFNYNPGSSGHFELPEEESNFENFDGSPYSIKLYSDMPETESDMDPLFWVGYGKDGGRVYFLGSMHCLDETAYRIPSKIMDAYESSDALAVECDILAYETDTAAQTKNALKMMYTDGSTIKDHVSKELYDAMVYYINVFDSPTIEEYGYTVELLEKLKPCMWQSVLETYSMDCSGLDYDYGIDYFFLNYATASEKRIIELESVEFQNDMSLNFSDELYEMLLWDSISTSPENSGKLLYESFEDWKIGDPETMISERTISKEENPDMSSADIAYYQALYDEYFDAMISDRNIGMAKKAAKMLDNGDNIFYVVGAGHMMGNDGVITILQDQGYEIYQIGGMDASEYTGGVEYLEGFQPPSSSDSDDGYTAPSSTAQYDYGEDDEYDYDLYEEMYEHFGGTTASKDTEATTKPTASTAKSNKSDKGGKDKKNSCFGSGMFDRALFYR